MLDFILMLQVTSLFVDRIPSLTNNKFVTGMESKATGDSKPNDSPERDICVLHINDTSIATCYIITCFKTFCCLPPSTFSPFLRILLLP